MAAVTVALMSWPSSTVLGRNRAAGIGERGRLARSFRRPAENIRPLNPFTGRCSLASREPVGGTPTGATETVALPILNRMVTAKA